MGKVEGEQPESGPRDAWIMTRKSLLAKQAAQCARQLDAPALSLPDWITRISKGVEKGFDGLFYRSNCQVLYCTRVASIGIVVPAQWGNTKYMYA